ncbi:hypothetical protein C8A05DRAFT_14928 [Staphylotrichum tortipilum]|uniref:M protein repeat protein n=1 Tax=Staphylotrichum tortipilum TaxID=2831512 RepID=A0AAN6MLG6_9PEZI|nr:hypothetical protein C8A05DRAFT_14928 [Staphylotrichum longicolle]
MRKAKAKKAGSSSKKGDAAASAPPTDDAPPSPATAEPTPEAAPEKQEEEAEEQKPAEEASPEDSAPAELTSPVPASSTPSLSQQSKARSTSFRQGSVSIPAGAAPLSPSLGGGAGATGLGLFSPEGETAPDIYRKHVQRIEELERENRGLVKEVRDVEGRWRKAEGELADLREGEGGEGQGEVMKLKTDLAALQRQNAQLQSQLARGRHGASPSLSLSTHPPQTELEAQLRSKSATLETMELEMSRLRAQVERLSSSASPSEQIVALEEKLARAEQAAGLAQRELLDVRTELDNASKRAVREGSERASAETQARALEQRAAAAEAAKEELVKKVEGLEKKAAALTTLHREQDGRAQVLRREKEAVEKEVAGLREKVERVEGENLRLRKKDAAEGGGDDEGVDELVEEERRRLEGRVRELEAENTDLKRGIWQERRKEMQVGPEEAARFETVDLGGAAGRLSPSVRKGGSGGSGFGEFFASGLNALTGAGAGAQGHGHGYQQHQHEELLEDDDMEFDEEAFRKAQEEEQKKRIERIKEIKRSLNNWEGWRLDLVENRRGGGEGIGEIFEI